MVIEAVEGVGIDSSDGIHLGRLTRRSAAAEPRTTPATQRKRAEWTQEIEHERPPSETDSLWT